MEAPGALRIVSEGGYSGKPLKTLVEPHFMPDLTQSVFDKIFNSLPKTPRVVGYALCPRDHSRLMQFIQSGNAKNFAGGLSIASIIDPRLTSDQIQVYYDQKSWSDRVREQNDWDNRKK